MKKENLKEFVRKIQSKKSLIRKLIIVSIVIVIFSLLLGGIALGLSFLNRSDSKDKFSIDNVNEDDIKNIERQLTYSSSDSSEKQYYSPEIDTLITYDSTKYSVSEGFNSIFFNLSRYVSNANFSGSIYLNEIENPTEKIIDKYKSRYETIEIVENKVDQNYLILKIKYDKKSYQEGNPIVNENRFIITNTIDNGSITLDVAYSDNFDIESSITDFKNILNSAEIAPSNLSQDSIIDITDPKLKFNFDIKKWDVGNNNEYSAQIIFRSSDFEITKENLYNLSSIRVYSDETLREVNDDYLKEFYLNQDLEFANDYFKDKQLEIIEEGSFVEIDEVKFLKLKYSYIDTFDSKNTREYYYGYDKRTLSVVTITLNFAGENSEGEKEIRSVLETFDFYSTGASVDFRNVLGASTSSQNIEIKKASVLGKLAVVRIFNRTCIDVKVSKIQDFTTISGKSYDNICIAGFGSGFYINKDGYIATNSHVAYPNSFDVLSGAVSISENQFYSDFFVDVSNLLKASGYDFASLTDTEIYNAFVFYLGEIDSKNGFTINATYENFIEDKEEFIINPLDYSIQNPTAHKEAEIIDGNEIDSMLKISLNIANGINDGIKIPDITILKVNNQNSPDLPALKLANPEVTSEGQEIIAIGFPGVLSNTTLFSSDSAGISTITNGNISAIKPNFDSSFKMVQIDASISGGNSGGPVINNNGEVVGLATYGIQGGETSAADYNVAVSVEELLKMTESNNIENDIGLVSTYVSDGLDNMSKQYYSDAIEDLEKAINLYPQSESLLSPFIKISEEKVNSGEDKSPVFQLGDFDLNREQFTIAIIAFVGLLIAFIILLGLILLYIMAKILFSNDNDSISDSKLQSMETMNSSSYVNPYQSYTQVNIEPDTKVDDHSKYMPQ